MNNLRHALAHLVFWVVPFWYNFTQWLTRKKTAAIPRIERPVEVTRRLRGGALYKPDPLRGVVDYMSHPGRVQRRLDRGEKVGDCDDHVAYWCRCLLTLPDVEWVKLGVVVYHYDGERLATRHTVALWEDDTGQRWWADYGKPRQWGEDWHFSHQVVESMGADVFYWAGTVDVTGLKHDRLRLRHAVLLD